MLRAIFAILSVSTLTLASQIGVLHTPSYVKFTSEPLSVPLSDVQSQIQHIMGFTVTAGTESFKPFASAGLFRRPKAVVAIEIDGLDQVPVEAVRSFDVVDDRDDADMTNLFASIRKTFDKDNSLLVDYDGTVSVDAALGNEATETVSPNDVQADAMIVLQDADLIASRSGATWSLKASEPIDAAFLVEVRRLLTMCSRIRELGARTADSVPDVFAFRIRAFAPLAEFYGAYSQQTHDAVSMLRFVIGKMNEVFRAAYDSNVVVLVLGLTNESDNSLHYRVKRQASSSSETTYEPPSINVAPSYTSDYAAYFNILLWLVVGIAITVLLVSWVMWNMDPGRDSIIYRMVQLPRIKKDN